MHAFRFVWFNFFSLASIWKLIEHFKIFSVCSSKWIYCSIQAECELILRSFTWKKIYKNNKKRIRLFLSNGTLTIRRCKYDRRRTLFDNSFWNWNWIEKKTSKIDAQKYIHKTCSRHAYWHSISLSRYVNIIKLRRLIFLIADRAINSEDETYISAWILFSSPVFLLLLFRRNFVLQRVGCVFVTNGQCSPNRSIEMAYEQPRQEIKKRRWQALLKSVTTMSIESLEWNMTVYRQHRDEKWLKRHIKFPPKIFKRIRVLPLSKICNIVPHSFTFVCCWCCCCFLIYPQLLLFLGFLTMQVLCVLENLAATTKRLK